MKGRRGFTLLELTVALSLFAVVLTIVLTLVQSVVRTMTEATALAASEQASLPADGFELLLPVGLPSPLDRDWVILRGGAQRQAGWLLKAASLDEAHGLSWTALILAPQNPWGEADLVLHLACVRLDAVATRQRRAAGVELATWDPMSEAGAAVVGEGISEASWAVWQDRVPRDPVTWADGSQGWQFSPDDAARLNTLELVLTPMSKPEGNYRRKVVLGPR